MVVACPPVEAKQPVSPLLVNAISGCREDPVRGRTPSITAYPYPDAQLLRPAATARPDAAQPVDKRVLEAGRGGNALCIHQGPDVSRSAPSRISVWRRRASCIGHRCIAAHGAMAAQRVSCGTRAGRRGQPLSLSGHREDLHGGACPLSRRTSSHFPLRPDRRLPRPPPCYRRQLAPSTTVPCARSVNAHRWLMEGSRHDLVSKAQEPSFCFMPPDRAPARTFGEPRRSVNFNR